MHTVVPLILSTTQHKLEQEHLERTVTKTADDDGEEEEEGKLLLHENTHETLPHLHSPSSATAPPSSSSGFYPQNTPVQNGATDPVFPLHTRPKLCPLSPLGGVMQTQARR